MPWSGWLARLATEGSTFRREWRRSASKDGSTSETHANWAKPPIAGIDFGSVFDEEPRNRNRIAPRSGVQCAFAMVMLDIRRSAQIQQQLHNLDAASVCRGVQCRAILQVLGMLLSQRTCSVDFHSQTCGLECFSPGERFDLRTGFDQQLSCA